MENSAYEALIIALNTFVFAVALTAGMVLMNSINEMVEYTKINIESEVGGNLIKEYGNEQERTFTGAEVLSYYGQKVNGKLEGVTIKVRAGGAETDIKTFGEGAGMGYLNKTFILECRGANNYLFRLKTT